MSIICALLAAGLTLGLSTQAAATAAEPTCKFLNVSIADHGSPTPVELGQVDAVVRAAIAAQHVKNADAFPAQSNGAFGMMKGGGLKTVGYSKDGHANQPKTFPDCLNACYDDCRCLGFHWSGKHARCGLKAEGDIAVSTDNRYQKTFRSFKRIMPQGCTPASASATTGAADTTTTTTAEPTTTSSTTSTTTTSSTTAEPTTTTTSISYTLIGQGLCADASGNLTRTYIIMRPDDEAKLDVCQGMCSDFGPRCVGLASATGFVEMDVGQGLQILATTMCFLFGSQLPPTDESPPNNIANLMAIVNGNGGSDNITTIGPTDLLLVGPGQLYSQVLTNVPSHGIWPNTNVTSVECYAK